VKKSARISVQARLQARSKSLGEKLAEIIAELPADTVTLVELRKLVGTDGLLLLSIFMALVFMVPVQIPGLGVLFGGAIALIGICRLRGRPLWLPARLAQRAMPVNKVRVALTKSLVWLHRLEYVSRPHRLNRLVSSWIFEVVNDAGLIVGGILLMAPIILVPFSNTLPALGVLFLAIGMLQRDGICILYGHIANLATVIYFYTLAAGGHALFSEWLLSRS
jgi:hypothetical protein